MYARMCMSVCVCVCMSLSLSLSGALICVRTQTVRVRTDDCAWAVQLTEAQSQMRSVRIARFAGTALGLGTGCLLGLTPLLFFDHPATPRP
jgi:hypothetical protein